MRQCWESVGRVLRESWLSAERVIVCLYLNYLTSKLSLFFIFLPDKRVTPQRCLPLYPLVLREQAQGWCWELSTRSRSVGKTDAPTIRLFSSFPLNRLYGLDNCSKALKKWKMQRNFKNTSNNVKLQSQRAKKLGLNSICTRCNRLAKDDQYELIMTQDHPQKIGV